MHHGGTQNLEHGPYISLRPTRLCGELVDTERSAQKVSPWLFRVSVNNARLGMKINN